MSHIIISGFKLKIAEPKRQRISSDGYVKTGKIVYGTVVESNGSWRVHIDVDKNGIKAPIILDFTPRSYDLENRQTVFLKHKDNRGNICRIIRDPLKARYFPGIPEQYIPFAHNWIVKGYIVKQGNLKLFDFKDLVGINGYVVTETDYEE